MQVFPIKTADKGDDFPYSDYEARNSFEPTMFLRNCWEKRKNSPIFAHHEREYTLNSTRSTMNGTRKSLLRCLLTAFAVGLLLPAAAQQAQPSQREKELHRYTSSLPATDELGRRLPSHEEVGDERDDRFVGLFYWTWHTNFANMMEPFDVTKFLREHPKAIDDFHDPAWGGVKVTHFWGEPLFGYYRDTDEWVLRKHAEMLGEAGVDVIIFDCTNGDMLWTESYMKLCEVFTQARLDGVKTPQIAFILAFAPTPDSRRAITQLYNELYKPKKYQDLWFYWKGKPLILAYDDDLSPEIQDFFTFRPGQPTYQGGPQNNRQWGWLEIYPQNGYVRNADGSYEEMPVGVAQNWSAERGLTAMNAPGSFGRSYTHKNGQSPSPEATGEGLNFQEQWDHALKVAPEFIFITGWNEWIAGRYEMWMQQPNAFPDEFSQEKSRDIEPMRGGHGDNYYYQMIANIRRFKGMPSEGESVPATEEKVDWTFWKGVDNGFRSHKGNTLHRSSQGWKGSYMTNETGRNDLVEAKVAHDRRNVYFYIECADEISSPQDSAWMRLFIDIDCRHETGWEGYDFIVNRLSPSAGKALLEQNSKSQSPEGKSWNWMRVREIPYYLRGNKLVISIPKRLLGINGSREFRLEFKWADNMQEEGNIADFLVNGDVAPLGRFNYVLKGKP